MQKCKKTKLVKVDIIYQSDMKEYLFDLKAYQFDIEKYHTGIKNYIVCSKL